MIGISDVMIRYDSYVTGQHLVADEELVLQSGHLYAVAEVRHAPVGVDAVAYVHTQITRHQFLKIASLVRMSNNSFLALSIRHVTRILHVSASFKIDERKYNVISGSLQCFASVARFYRI